MRNSRYWRYASGSTRNGLHKRRSFYKSERRVFCACELCRLRYGVMLYSISGGEPIRTYRRKNPKVRP